MAAVTVLETFDRIPLGDVWEQTFRVDPGAGAADEWLPTGFSRVLGCRLQAIGTSAGASSNAVLNAQGTGEAEGSSPGDLGIEASTGDLFVTVLGR